jgi:hypothetical protein
MPYNGSGTFTLPAGNPVVTGTTISSTTTNATNTDIANGLSNAVTRNGQSPATANLPMGGFKLTGLGEGTTAGESVAYGGSPAFAKVTLTAANNTATGGGQLYLTGATGNRIDFYDVGSAPPAFTTRCLGTKIVLWPGVSATAVDFAMGIDSATLWNSVPTSAYYFKWYAGTTLVATLSGTGEFTPIKALRGCYGAGAQITNFAAGDGALDSNTSGYNNVAIGKDALTDNTTGAFNVAMGRAALSQNINGTDNIAIGNEALLVGTSPDLNIAIGTSALTNCYGNSNVAIGYLAGSGVLGGSNNVIIGGDDGTGVPISTSGSNNIVLADGAGNVRAYYTNSTSSWTIPNKFAVTGTVAITGATNTAALTAAGAVTITGAFALRGSYGAGAVGSNFAAGDRALDSNTSGLYTTAVGVDALTANTTGDSNTAVGRVALYKNTTGSINVAVGNEALYSNTTGDYNTAVGNNALFANTIGYDNTAVGGGALTSNTTGFGNTSVGTASLTNNTTGDYNTALGHSGLNNVSTGNGNVGIGFVNSAGTYAPVFDVVAENNRIVMGSTSVTNAYVKVAWTVTSDARDKTNFAPVPHGLDFVTKLQPTAYQFKEDRETDVATGPVRYGFKAQDVLALEGDAPVIIDNEDLNHLRINSDSLIPVLVNAIKELTARLEALEGTL